ncbi:MAG TPA: 1-acyl-sn-glycerol-3-phosphate acyltransferase [Chitinophagales bacterium]|nr:1-acyl-sn-glycerol-3-phosphate acyltransferase [Chitinophagales bacterium]
MKRLISFIILLSIKGLTNIFYRFRIGWPKETIRWNDVRLIVFLNHTSLYEPLFIGFLPIKFLWMLSKRMAIPGATKTMDRPIVGFFFKLFSPGMVPITRKRDNTWDYFLESLQPDSIIIIAAEGRMMRKNGLDLDGKKMNVRPGVADVLKGLNTGQMVFAYSGGLHHIQVPGEGAPRLFKTIKMNLEVFDIPDYKAMFIKDEHSANHWKADMLADMQHRLETKPPR